LLKFAEISADDLRRIAAGSNAVSELTADLREVGAELQRISIQSTNTRRSLRAQLGDGGYGYDGGTLHRSTESREAFDRAVELAEREGSSELRAIHLLRAVLATPTKAIRTVLGDVQMVAAAHAGGPTPLIDRLGLDLAADAQGAHESEASRPAECVALMHLLATGRKHIAVISDDPWRVRRCLVSAACHCPGLVSGRTQGY